MFFPVQSQKLVTVFVLLGFHSRFILFCNYLPYHYHFFNWFFLVHNNFNLKICSTYKLFCNFCLNFTLSNCWFVCLSSVKRPWQILFCQRHSQTMMSCLLLLISHIKCWWKLTMVIYLKLIYKIILLAVITQWIREVVVAQLVERSLSIPKVRGSTPVIGKILLNICFLSTVLKRQK